MASDSDPLPWRTTHGHTANRKATPEYTAWLAMIDRCTNPKCVGFKRYGGRGITICERWRRDFAAFFADVGPRPAPKHSLDRKDNNGNYEPGNVRWATRTEQNRNKRTNHWIEYDGRRMLITDWAREMGVSTTAIRLRLARGWTVAATLTTPSQRPAMEG